MGWIAVKDPASGDTYYWNKATGETSWSTPHGSSTKSEQDKGNSSICSNTRNEALPSGWKAVKDPTSGDEYYWNTETNETSWSKPSESTEISGKITNTAFDACRPKDSSKRQLSQDTDQIAKRRK